MSPRVHLDSLVCRHTPDVFLAQIQRRHHFLHNRGCLKHSLFGFFGNRRCFTWSLKLTGRFIRYLFLLISMATFGLKILSSSRTSSSSSSLKYCNLEVDILDCIIEALVDILDCILEVLIDILDPDIVVFLVMAQHSSPTPTIEHSAAKSHCPSPLFKKLPGTSSGR